MLQLKIRYLVPDLEPLCYVEGKSDWIDLRAARDISFEPGEFKLIPLGIAVKLPEGYEAHVAPRSSTFKNFGLLQVNSVGVVDSSYCGDGDEWFVPMLATRAVTVHKGDRICQFRIVENQPALSFVEVEHLEGKDRGGFGSTGLR
ncbi:MAG: dUTP diphosphatase [Lachnospiraceae bacterium]|nr:dUTP diphosphatase [Lachnospiraceae bacterium]